MIEERKKKARDVLQTMFEVMEKDIVFMKCRKANMINARKFYNYYLLYYLGVNHNKMKHHIYGMHHATSIYLKNKLEFEFDHYSEIRDNWLTFLFFADHDAWGKQKEIKEAKSKYLI